MIARELARSARHFGFGDTAFAASRPGRPERTNGDTIVVRGAARYASNVAIYRPTVWVEDPCNLWQLCRFLVSPGHEFTRSDALHPGADAAEYEGWGVDQMRVAAEIAKFVALRHLGYEVTQIGEGVFVVAVGPSPADGILEPGDIIVAVDDVAIGTTDELTKALVPAAARGSVQLTVHQKRPEGERSQTVNVPLAPRPPLLGAVVRTHEMAFDFPVDLVFPSEGAGASGSLATALGIVDALSPGDLCVVPTAATGVLRRNLSIGSVTGVAQKAHSLRRTEVRRFLVPSGAGEEAKSAAVRDLEIVEVGDWQGALDAVTRPVPIGSTP